PQPDGCHWDRRQPRAWLARPRTGRPRGRGCLPEFGGEAGARRTPDLSDGARSRDQAHLRFLNPEKASTQHSAAPELFLTLRLSREASARAKTRRREDIPLFGISV